ncbi:MAG: hypothetical protein QXX64_05195 [Nitrososphaera sp.]|nr:hypothetical protein [Candidatus Nitrososphaera gargensis]
MSYNSIMGTTGPINTIGISIEVLQAAFIGLMASIIAYKAEMGRFDKKTLLQFGMGYI